MSRLAEYRQLEQLIARQTADLERLKNDPGLEREIEFETKLHALLGEYAKSLKDIRSILGDETAKPGRAVAPVAQGRSRQARTVKVYRNPLTGETVESKGGNNRLLGAWKAQFGAEEVETWVKR